MPTGGGNEKTLEYQDTIDMIYELIKKYQPSHYIIIVGDLNEDSTSWCYNIPTPPFPLGSLVGCNSL
jgi:metallophosphoesterase superfamily enzyme